MNRILTALAATALAASGCAQAQVATPPPGPVAAAAPSCQTPAHRAFDFWVGEWRVFVTGAETLAGLSTITLEHNGCVVTEHWRSQRSPYSGRSLNLYSAEAQHWEQFWVDSAGDVTHFVGNPTPDGMQLTAEDDVSPGAPAPVINRMIFTRNPDGSVRQHGQSSSDRGASWADSYDFTYRRVS